MTVGEAPQYFLSFLLKNCPSRTHGKSSGLCWCLDLVVAVISHVQQVEELGYNGTAEKGTSSLDPWRKAQNHCLDYTFYLTHTDPKGPWMD